MRPILPCFSFLRVPLVAREALAWLALLLTVDVLAADQERARAVDLTAPAAAMGSPAIGSDAPAGASGVESSLMTTTLPRDAELESSHAVIGEVMLDNQNIFDLSDDREDVWPFRLANRLHVTTRPYVIRQQLLFRSGDLYSRRLLEESERMLRLTRYLYDASIRPVRYHDGKVDVLVTTRDVWTFDPGLSFGRHGGSNSTGGQLEELNVAGTGIALGASHSTDIDRTSTLYSAEQSHLLGTWTAVRASYADNSDGSAGEIAVDHPFYALDVHRAGGADVLTDNRIDALYDRGAIIDQFRERHRFAESYIGWSPGLADGWVPRFSAGFTLDEREFESIPAWNGPVLLPLPTRLAYPWLQFALVQDDFLKLWNHDQIERTEDFYIGTQVRTRIGWSDPAFGADRRALVFLGTASRGLSVGATGTILVGSTLTGRLENGTARNTVLDTAIRYYLEESRGLLFFTTLQGTLGHNLDLQNQILLGGDSGLRGYPLRFQSGTARALATVEQRYFTDWYPFRLFRLGGAVFFDAGRTFGPAPLAAPNLGLLRDVGLGLRFGNSRSGLGNITHVDIAVPLDRIAGIRAVQFIVETQQRF
jgi:hypothetical protein